VKSLVPNNDEQKIIKRMAALRKKGWSLRAIAQDLEKRGIQTKTGRLKWHPQMVKAVLDGAKKPRRCQV